MTKIITSLETMPNADSGVIYFRGLNMEMSEKMVYTSCNGNNAFKMKNALTEGYSPETGNARKFKIMNISSHRLIPVSIPHTLNSHKFLLGGAS